MNKIEKIKRVGQRTYVDILDGSDNSIFTLRIFDPLSELTDTLIEMAVNGSMHINGDFYDEHVQSFDGRGCSHVGVIENISDYFAFKRLKEVKITGNYDQKLRYDFKAYIVYLNHNIDWIFELCSTICGNKEEAIDVLYLEQFRSDVKTQIGPDIKVVFTNKKGDLKEEDRWMEEILFKKDNESTTEQHYCMDSLEEFLKFKDPNGTDLQSFIEMGLIKPIGKFKAFKNMVKYSEAEALKIEYSN